MSHRDQAFADLIAANPVPAGDEPPAMAWSATVLLDEIDSRDEATRPDQPIGHRGEEHGHLPTGVRDGGHSREPRRGPLWAVAAAIVLLVGAVASITLTGDDIDVETDTTTVPTTAPPSPSTPSPDNADDVSEAGLGDPQAGWYRIDRSEDLPDNLNLVDVTTLGSRLVAVGANGLVVSDDGVDWTFHEMEPEAEADGWMGSVHMEAVVEGGPGLVAVGHVFDSERNRAAVWTSVDGTDWERVPHDDEVFGRRETYMSDIVVGGPGLVAVGEDADSGYGEMAVWTSVDGVSWTRVTDLPPHQGAFEGGLREIVAGGPGLVAVGEGGIYVSADGASWSQSEDSGDGEFSRVFATGSVLAVPLSDRVLTSEDGLRWTEVEADPFEGMTDFAVVGDRFIGVAGGGYAGPPSFWSSTDGLDWTLVSALEGADFSLSLTAVTPGGPGAVAVGGRSIWVYTADAEAAAALGYRGTSLREHAPVIAPQR